VNKHVVDEALDRVKIIDTHEHFSSSANIVNEGADLPAILPRGYVGFFDFYPGLQTVNFEKYPELKCKDFPGISTFIKNYHEFEFVDVLDAGIKNLHGKSIKNMKEHEFLSLNQSILHRYADPAFRDSVLKAFNVERVILDVPHHAGGLQSTLSDAFDSQFYKPAMRLNSLLYGFDLDAWNPQTCLMKLMASDLKVIDRLPVTFEDFLDKIDRILEWSKGKVVSYKCASAYERTINFGPKLTAQPKGKKYAIAKGIFGKPFCKTVEYERLVFGDYVLHHVLSTIEGNGIPVQMHTGTAIMPGSDPKNVDNLIAEYPGIHFTLLHCGYPWTETVLDMLKRHDNVHGEMVWLQTISREAATRFLERAIAEKLHEKVIAFGGDCASIEGSVGALLTIKAVARSVLTRMVDDGRIQKADAGALIEDLFYNNPKAVFFKK